MAGRNLMVTNQGRPMPFEHTLVSKKKIAIIGAGISGLGAAHRLSHHHNIVVFEASNRLGGHARTIIGGKNGDMPIDTGFLVFNDVNYPHLIKLFDDLNIERVHSDMSFGVSIDDGWLEYALLGFDKLFAQKRNAIRPKYLGMLRDILKFNAQADKAARGTDQTIGQLIKSLGLGAWFKDYYLTPFTGAIWSTPVEDILEFPAHAMIAFMKNHQIMGMTGQHQWQSVKGGSQVYVGRLAARLRGNGVEIRTSTSVDAVRRSDGIVEVKVAGGEWEIFDDVIFATHSDQTMAMLTDPTPIEHAALSAVRYQPNEMVLHADENIMPNRKAAWASWVYTEDKDKKSDRIDLTYWINNLQALPDDDPAFVTLNTQRFIDPSKIYDTHTFHHPVFDTAAIKAQSAIAGINGDHHTWYCGAWMRNGFHEDGLATGIEAAEGLLAKDQVMLAAE